MDTALKVGLIIGGAGALGLVIYLASRSSTPAAQATAGASAPTPTPIGPGPAPPPTVINLPLTHAAQNAGSNFALRQAPTTYAITVSPQNASPSAALKVGDTLRISPAPLDASMTQWTRQFCPSCVWTAGVSSSQGVVSLNGGQAAVVLSIQEDAPGTWVITALGQGSATIDVVYADVSGNPVGERFSVTLSVSP